MGRNKTTIKSKLEKISNTSKNVLVADIKSGKLYCTICDEYISTITNQAWLRHQKTYKHASKKNIFELEYQLYSSKTHLWAEGFGGAGIPINNLRKEVFRKAMSKIDINLPSPNTVKKSIF